MAVIGIVLADDHEIVRQGLRLILEGERQFKIIAEASDGLQALQLLEKFQPDVLIVDIAMPGLNGMEVIRQARRVSPLTRVIALSMHASESYVLAALRNGATGYVLKEFGSEHLVDAVRKVAAGGQYLSPPLIARAVQTYVERAESLPRDSYDLLTTREREILQLAAEGHTSSQIAARLGISPRTAESHRGTLMRKLGIHNQSELIRYALERGVVAGIIGPPGEIPAAGHEGLPAEREG